MHVAYSLSRAPASAGLALRPPVLVAGVPFHRWSPYARLHLALGRPAPLARASDALRHSSTRRLTLLLVRPFAPNRRLLRPRLTSRSMSPRRPFRHKARSPQVRTHSFPAQPPDLRHFALATRASRLLARSPCSAAPSIRFLSIGSQVRSTLPPHGQSPFRSCASLRSLWPVHGRTCTSKSAPMLGAQKTLPRRAASWLGCRISASWAAVRGDPASSSFSPHAP